MLKRILLFSIFSFLLMGISFSHKCDKVAELPPEFSTLLPDFDKIKHIHLNNYFFVETGSTKKINIPIKEKSVFKYNFKFNQNSYYSKEH